MAIHFKNKPTEFIPDYNVSRNILSLNLYTFFFNEHFLLEGPTRMQIEYTCRLCMCTIKFGFTLIQSPSYPLPKRWEECGPDK